MKKTYRIQLFEHGNLACKTAVLAAAMINGGNYSLTLPDIKKLAENENCPDTTAELLGDDILCIDVKAGEKWERGCHIEEVEVFELEETGAMAE